MNRFFDTRIFSFARRAMRSLPALLALSLGALLGTSCVKESLGDCPPVKLVIEIDMEIDMDVDMDVDMGSVDPTFDGRVTQSDIREWYSDIETVSVWIFDHNERFVAQWNGGPYTPGKEYVVPVGELGLGGGEHTFVVWTNGGDHYRANHPDPDPADNLYLDDFEMRMNLPDEGEFRDDLRHRHYGILEGIDLTPIAPGQTIKTTILISPNLHKVNFSMGGIAPDDHTYSLSVADSNSAHSFRNERIPGANRYRHRRNMAFQTPEVTPSRATSRQDAALLSTSLLLMQLHDDTQTRVDVTRHTPDGDEVIYDENLVELINRVYAFNGQTVDFDHTLEFDVDVAFMPVDDEADLRLAITINGWTYIEEVTIL